MKRIICFHLYNDFSGSPIVLRMVLEGLLRKGFKVDLVTSNGGVLDELIGMEGFKKHTYFYRFSTNPAVTMARYSAVQIYTFFLAFRWIFNRDVVFYINTLLPVAPALAGRIMGKRVVYHYHENAFVKGFFYKTLSWMMQRLAHEIICVSEYQASSLANRSKVSVIPNALPKTFIEKIIRPAQGDNHGVALKGRHNTAQGETLCLDASHPLPLSPADGGREGERGEDGQNNRAKALSYVMSPLQGYNHEHTRPTVEVEIFPATERAYNQKNILMLASLKAYKGTREFIELSAKLPEYRFTLVLNDSQENIDEYISANRLDKTIGKNLTIYPRQNDVTPFYKQASLVLNLSDKNRFIETFGMTVLEAMSAALPVIVPTVGGVAEMVDDGVNGYKIDVSEMDNITKRIREMLKDKDTYTRMSHNALKRARLYDSEIMTEKITKLILGS